MKRATHAQRGAALLAAMITVTLVATLAAGALWRQWRGVEVEGAERAAATGWPGTKPNSIRRPARSSGRSSRSTSAS